MSEDAVPGLDISKPSVARVYDAALGGKDNFAVDRAALEGIRQAIGQTPGMAYANRAMLRRAVRYLVTQAGIRQFVDLGSGLPTRDNTHQVAQRAEPGARVVYVDIDPMVLAHARALLALDDKTAVVTADLTQVETVLGHPELRRLIDMSEPVAILLVGMLHHFPEDADPGGIVAAYMDAVPSGSHLFITHFCRSGPAAEAMERDCLKYLGTGWFRTKGQIQAYFDGLEMVDPGLVYLAQWRPDPLYDRELTPLEDEPEGNVVQFPRRLPGGHLDDDQLTVVDKLVVGGIGRKL